MFIQKYKSSALVVGLLSLGTWGCDAGDDPDPEGGTGGSPEGCGMVEADNAGTEALALLPEDKTLPIVFVHGFAGSAQQFESQAMRFVANGYPQERISAYDHDGAGTDIPDFAEGVDEAVDAALAKFGTSQVYLAGHSRGTSVSSLYLGDAAQAAKVAKYVSLDGRGCKDVTIPCLELNKAGLGGQTHVEVATSREAFAKMYEFYLDEKPTVVDVVRQSSPVSISGRAVDFPANTGKAGSDLEIYEVDHTTGHRACDAPLATFTLGADGSFGPLDVDPRKYYELVLHIPEQGDHHFYMQRFLRDSQFVRLLSGSAESESRLHTNTGPGHAAIIMMRMREWKTEDIVEVGTTSPSLEDQDPVNVISAATGDGNIAIYLHDDADSPADSTQTLLDWFSEQPFQTGIDFYMPASDPPDGTITLTNMPRGDTSKPQVLRTPNWPSEGHTISVLFADFPHPAD